MKQLAVFAVSFVVGYLAVTRVGPAIQAKIESQDIDYDWEFWNGSDAR